MAHLHMSFKDVVDFRYSGILAVTSVIFSPAVNNNRATSLNVSSFSFLFLINSSRAECPQIYVLLI